MNKYLSLIFLYNRASYKKLLLIFGAIPITLTLLLFIRVGNPTNTEPFMLMENAFGGIFGVILLIAIILGSLLAVVNSLNSKKELMMTHATVGYTMRRLRISPIKAYLTIVVYYLAIIIIFWAVTIASMMLIGKICLILSTNTTAGAGITATSTAINTKLALGLLRTEIGHALIPFSHPLVIAFNITAMLALATECARSCYLSWHNGRQSASIAIIVIPMAIVWTCNLEGIYLLACITVVFFYMVICIGDILSREYRPKGDPFMVNKYIGIMDMDSTEFDDNVFLESNSLVEDEDKKTWWLGKFLPVGINMEKVNTLLGVLTFTGIAEHLIFYGKYMMTLKAIESSIKGVTIDSGIKMTPFWELQQHTYYGYIFAIIAVALIQAYWNYSYYNKETKSVYVMKRLPNRREYTKTIWLGPIIEAVIIATVMIVHTLIDYCWYMLATPDIALM